LAVNDLREYPAMISFLFYLMIVVCLVLWVDGGLVLKTNSIMLRPNPAESLEEWLKRFSFKQKGEVQNQGQLPIYKFYTEVIEILLNLSRKMGGNYQDSLLYLREGLQNDRQFEKKLKEMILGTWMQMGMMMVLTWGFIIASLFIVEIKVAAWKLIGIFCWQTVGMGLLPLLLKRLRTRFFADIGRLWKMLYVLNSLVRVPLARSEVMGLAGIVDLALIKQKNLASLVEKLRGTCERALKLGGSYEEDVRSLMDELRFQEKWSFELFEKRLTVIKLALISLFFLPSYLGFIFLLLGDLLSTM
jgi:hypothetical protein